MSILGNLILIFFFLSFLALVMTANTRMVVMMARRCISDDLQTLGEVRDAGNVCLMGKILSRQIQWRGSKRPQCVPRVCNQPVPFAKPVWQP